MAYFDELLQRAITVRNNRAPASNTADLVGGVLVGIVTALQMLLDDKQDELTFDTAPTADSPNPVTSDGIYQALQAIDLSACEKIVNKVTSISAQSTDVQYPTAKLLYDSLQALANVYAPKVHTHPFADIERPANVASVNAQGYTITTAYYSHVLTITADATLHLPTMQSGAAIILRLTIIQDATGGRAVTFDGGAALVFNPYQTDLSLGQANYRCWVVLWFDGVNWAWLASPYVLRAESQFAYTIDGTTGGQYVTVTINGTTMQIQATSGVWQYGYNNPINSIAFTGDTGVLNVDFTNSDGLANITTLADAFKNCAALVAVDFTGCDLSNVATAADCFAGCTSLAALTIPTGTWKPDIDLSACAAFTKAAMLAVIDGLYTYASGTHTVTFNSTAWDALSQADQQQVYNAADAKGWTTNAVAVTYVIRGTSSNVNGTETFNIQFIQDGAQTPDAAETITCAVDGQGNWEYDYIGKKIYSLNSFAQNNSNIITAEFEEDMSVCETAISAFENCASLSAITLPNATFAKLINATRMFIPRSTAFESISLPNATFENLLYADDGQNIHFSGMFCRNEYLQSINLPSATFDSLIRCNGMFEGCTRLTTINLPQATFASATNMDSFALNCAALAAIDLSKATFANVLDCRSAFEAVGLVTLSLPLATFASATEARRLFFLTPNLASLSLPNATFENLQNGGRMFSIRSNAATLTIDLTSATFENLLSANNDNNTTYGGMFCQNTNLQTLSMPNATFERMTNGLAMFYNTRFTTLSIPNATFAAISNTNNMFISCTALTAISLPSASPSKPTIAHSISFQSQSALTYQSMVNVANWCKDLTGGTAQTVKFNATAWNALTAAEQATIQGILSGKNWTLATA